MELNERKERAKRILKDLYLNGYVETLYNTLNERYQKEGWTLKNGKWSPWFFNLRPVGNSPRIVAEIAYTMNHILRDEIPNLDQIVGIEMAGVPLVSAIGTTTGSGCELISYSYTRPLPGKKVRNLQEAKEVLFNFKSDYGEKELVEGRFEDNEVLCIVDDMVTDFASKLITKAIIEYDMERRNIKNVTTKYVAVVLDREQGAEEEAKKNGMNLISLIKFKTQGLDWLKESMIPQEHELISDYQQNPNKYQDKDLQKKVIKEANKFRR